MVLYSTVLYYIVLYSTLCNFMIVYGIVWYCMVMYGTYWYCKLYLDTVQYFIVLSKCYSMVLYGTACYFMFLYDIVCYCILGVLFIEAVAPATCTILLSPPPSDYHPVHWLYLSPNVRHIQKKLTCAKSNFNLISGNLKLHHIAMCNALN